MARSLHPPTSKIQDQRNGLTVAALLALPLIRVDDAGLKRVWELIGSLYIS